MSYSLDLRKRVLSYISSGHSKQEASKVFQVGRSTIYTWLSRKDLSPQNAKTRHCKINKSLLAAHVKKYPDAILRERAKHFGVSVNAIWSCLRKMDIKKKDQ